MELVFRIEAAMGYKVASTSRKLLIFELELALELRPSGNMALEM